MLKVVALMPAQSEQIDDSDCIFCGACCATYRVSFYWGETDVYSPGGVPEGATVKLNYHYVAMRGTNQKNPGCHALQGEINKQVNCSIYENRPTPCREFAAGDARCYEARVKHGVKKQLAVVGFSS